MRQRLRKGAVNRRAAGGSSGLTRSVTWRVKEADALSNERMLLQRVAARWWVSNRSYSSGSGSGRGCSGMEQRMGECSILAEPTAWQHGSISGINSIRGVNLARTIVQKSVSGRDISTQCVKITSGASGCIHHTHMC